MLKQKTFIFDGPPVPLMRPRLTKYGIWDPQGRLKKDMGLVISAQHIDQELFVGPLRLDIVFYMPMPNSWSHKKKLAHVGKDHISRPDLDNLIKLPLDVCNKIIFHDDCTISWICAKKVYDDEPRTEIIVRELT